jgi:hypothetical protein
MMTFLSPTEQLTLMVLENSQRHSSDISDVELGKSSGSWVKISQAATTPLQQRCSQAATVHISTNVDIQTYLQCMRAKKIEADPEGFDPPICGSEDQPLVHPGDG